MRTTWATGWAAQLAAGSELITLMFPIMPEPLGDQGPPFPLTCKLYDDLLLPAGMNPNAWPSGGLSLVLEPEWGAD